jgi:hypothetical protein
MSHIHGGLKTEHVHKPLVAMLFRIAVEVNDTCADDYVNALRSIDASMHCKTSLHNGIAVLRYHPLPPVHDLAASRCM